MMDCEKPIDGVYMMSCKGDIYQNKTFTNKTKENLSKSTFLKGVR